MERMKNKTVVITGASSGAGRAIAIECAKNGSQLVLAARREQTLNEVVKECETLGADAISVVTDVTVSEQVKHLAERAKEWGGKIDVWVNNAGVLAAGRFEETPVKVHDQVIKTNLIGYIHGAHAVMPYFKQQGYGIIINNISVGGWFPTPFAVGYTASKFGLRGFSEALKGELSSWPNIHVCDLFPAFLDTPGIQHAANYTGRYLKPAPPVYDPIEVAQAVVELSVNPQRAKTIGSAATFLRVVHSVFPVLSRSITAGVVQKYLNAAKPLPVTPGNIFEPQEYGTSIHGGWGMQPQQQKSLARKALLAAGFVAGLLLVRSLK